ncbi:MAG TPA: type II toxin-antitoxin system VapC family toxin [Streptosporangiaceae bacterium]|nr:type II toxin-antitoxin system VapC family toxin [Streptosporangiaceae bacterium]
MIYLDSSALAKLVMTELESPALSQWLAERPDLIRVSSSIIRAEVPRAVCRRDATALSECYQVIRRLRQVRLTEAVLARAGTARPFTMRALDAIHLASALTIRQELTAFVCYDKRLLAAAREAGLPTASPA